MIHYAVQFNQSREMYLSSLFLIILLTCAFAQYLNTTGCPNCLESRCPKNDKQCSLGLIQDLCGCCPNGVCAKIEGEECYNATLIPPPPLDTKKYGMCGQNLNCLYKSHFSDWDMPHASCVCDDTRIVCSSDNKTYNSICDMKLQAKKNGIPPEEIFIKNYGPCIAIPVISNGPKDKTASIGDSIMLSCEARGYPIPVVTWNFIPRDKTREMKQLPADAPNIAVQARGGPDAFMTTGWVQIISVRESDAGIYTCIAANDLGQTKISARITVKELRDEV